MLLDVFKTPSSLLEQFKIVDAVRDEVCIELLGVCEDEPEEL